MFWNTPIMYFQIWQVWQHRCWATCQISKRLEYLKYKYHVFLLLVENKRHNVTLRNCCFIVIIDHISIYGPPNRYTDHPTIPRGWSVGARATHDFRLWTAMPGPLLLPRADTSNILQAASLCPKCGGTPATTAPPPPPPPPPPYLLNKPALIRYQLRIRAHIISMG